MVTFSLTWAEDEFARAEAYFDALKAVHDGQSPATTPPVVPTIPADATVIFHEDWRNVTQILPPDAYNGQPNWRWTDGSNAPNGNLSVVHDAGGSSLVAAVKDALGHNDGARAFMTIGDPRWDDLPALEGKTVYWLITAFLDDMPIVQSGAGLWWSIAQIKRKDSEAPAYCEVNVRGDRGYNELYLTLGGNAYLFDDHFAELTSNTPFTFMLEVNLSRNPGVGYAYLHFNGERIGATGATLNPSDGGGAFALTSYGNCSPSLRVAFGDVTFAVLG